jgi:hypothetical protein
MNTDIFKAIVKATGKEIQVYKLKDGRYNRFLGDTLSIEKLDAKEHLQTFDASDLEVKYQKGGN